MRILQVIHDFLPRHQAGSELYCYHLSKTLQQLGHDVKLCFTEIDHDHPHYSTREGEYDGLPFLEIVNNHAYHGFEETYSNPNIETAFARLLDNFKPDVAHFHHALGLSFGCIRLCKERGVAVVFTLHDYWLTCPRGGGQRFRGEGKVCHDVDPSLCAECISRFSFPARAGQRVIKKLLTKIDTRGSGTLIHAMLDGTIDTPKRNFVSHGTCAINNDAREAIFAHPPSAVSFTSPVPKNSALTFSYAMDPSTYEKSGDGVRFTVWIDNKKVFEKTLNAKQNPDDRGWHQGIVPLADFGGNKRTIRFKTEAVPDGKIDFTTACWGEPRIIQPDGASYTPKRSASLITLAERLLSSMQKRGLQRQVLQRRDAALTLFDQADLFIAPSKFLRSKFIEYGMKPEKIVFSDYGIADISIHAEPRKPELPLQFTFIGTVVEHKGLHVLIEAFNRLPQDAAVLNVYGALHEFEGYAAKIRSMILHPGIHLRGRAENADIAGILERTDALIVPSIWFENSPITIHEAFLARVPVITSRFGGMADLVQDGVNGLLFEMGNPDDLYRCLKSLVDSPNAIESLRPDPRSVKSLNEDGEWMVQQYERLLRVHP